MKLKSILFLMFIALTTAPLVILGFFSTSYYNDKLAGVLENDLSVATVTQVESINHFLEERDTTISIVSDYGDVHRLFTASRQQEGEEYLARQGAIGAILDSYVTRSEYLISASILDRSYEILASNVEDAVGTISELGQVDLKYLDGKIHFTPVIQSSTNGVEQKAIAIIKGIYVDGELAGYFVEEMNLKFFEKVRAAVNLFNDGTVYLVDGTGNVITAGSGSDSRQEFVTTPEERRDYDRAMAERDPTANRGILRYKILGQRYISYYSNFEHADWTIVCSMNVDEIIKMPMDALKLVAVIFGLLLLACLIVNHLLTARIAKPLDGIVTKFRRIKETQDYSIRMDDISSSEIGTIATEINFLLANVEAHMDEEKEKQSRLHQVAATDPLTGLLNKRAMDKLVGQTLAEAERTGEALALLYLDVDDFKNYNTRYGHGGGDKVLLLVAQTLRELFSISCRVGGDEFVSCMTGDADFSGLEDRLEALRSTLERGLAVEGAAEAVAVRCSIGVAIRRPGEDYETLLGRADEAMYQVKKRDKNGYIILR